MRQFMCQHGLLLLRIDPVQNVYRLFLRIVVSRDLLLQHRHQKWPQLKIPWNQPEFFQHLRRPLQPLRILVVLHSLVQIRLHFLPIRQFAFDLMLDRQSGIAARKLNQLIHRPKQFLSLLRRNNFFWSRSSRRRRSGSLCSADALARGFLIRWGLRGRPLCRWSLRLRSRRLRTGLICRRLAFVGRRLRLLTPRPNTNNRHQQEQKKCRNTTQLHQCHPERSE